MTNYRILKRGETILPGDEWLDNRDNVWKVRHSRLKETLYLATEGGFHLPHRRKLPYPEHTPPAPPEGMRWEYRGEAWSSKGEKTTYYFLDTQREGHINETQNSLAVGLEGIHYFEAVPDADVEKFYEKMDQVADTARQVLTSTRCKGCGGAIVSKLCSCGTPHPEYEGPDNYRCRATIPESTEPPYTEAELMENPKESAGRKKCPMHLLSPSAMRETANALGHGAEKYQARNYRTAGVNATTYVGAILRHITAWNDGEDLDPESGLSHIAHVAACADILLDTMACGMMNDDRSKKP